MRPLIICAVAIGWVTWAGTARADDVPAGEGGMRVEVDRSGRFVEHSTTPAAMAPAAASRSTVGLIETPANGGGMSVHLQGRFQSAMTADVAPDGDVHVGCVAHSGDTPR